MSQQKLIDLSKVPVPDIITPLDFEKTYSDLKAILITLDPQYSDALTLESDPLARLLQVFAYREMHLIAKINDATRANILASATGNDLIALGSRYNLTPLIVQPANPNAIPPTPEVRESDENFRRRVQMAFDGLNTAGSIDAYIFFALSADGRVLDANAESPTPCNITVTILSHEGNGTPSNSTLTAVRAYFGLTPDGNSQNAIPSKIRPQGDRVTVVPAQIIPYSITAQLYMQPGPDASVVLIKAQNELSQYIAEQRRLGANITRSGIHRALHQPGVSNVLISSPATDLVISPTQASFCTATNITVGGVDE